MTIAMTTSAAAGLVRGPSIRRRWRPVAIEAVTAPSAPVELTWSNRRPGSPGFAGWAEYAGERIDAHGLSAATHEVQALVTLARSLGAAPVAVEVLADASQPEPARLRAFAHVVQAILRPS